MKQSTAVLALLGITQSVNVNKHKKFAEGLGEFEIHGQSLKMKEKTLQEFNVPQLSDK